MLEVIFMLSINAARLLLFSAVVVMSCSACAKTGITCPAVASTTVQYVGIYDGPISDNASLEETEHHSDGGAVYVRKNFEAGSFITLDCQYHSGLHRVVTLKLPVTRCSYTQYANGEVKTFACK